MLLTVYNTKVIENAKEKNHSNVNKAEVKENAKEKDHSNVSKEQSTGHRICERKRPLKCEQNSGKKR